MENEAVDVRQSIDPTPVIVRSTYSKRKPVFRAGQSSSSKRYLFRVSRGLQVQPEALASG